MYLKIQLAAVRLKFVIPFFLLLCSTAFAAERTERTIDIGHAQLQVEVWESTLSNDETIIALPGSGGDITRYKYLAPLLADAGYRVVAVNQRGIMGSTGELEGLTLYDYAACLLYTSPSPRDRTRSRMPSSA